MTKHALFLKRRLRDLGKRVTAEALAESLTVENYKPYNKGIVAFRRLTQVARIAACRSVLRS